MPVVAEKTWFVDVQYHGGERLIACGVLETDDGLALVDPGPAVSLGGLGRGLAERGASLADVHALLLTHIHLDHAGATGSIVAAHPRVQVFVHRIGALHMVDPGRLLASARRIYGDRLDALWGAFLATPADNVHPLDGGETLSLGGRRIDVLYTPGHAVHHVTYLDEATGTAFVGDTAGMRVTGVPFVVPVAPPPDVQVEHWRASLAAIGGRTPERLFLTHFGPSEEADWHLAEMDRKLVRWSEDVRRSLAGDGDDDARAEAFHAAHMEDVPAGLALADRLPYERLGQPRSGWYGLARYWRKHAPPDASPA